MLLFLNGGRCAVKAQHILQKANAKRTESTTFPHTPLISPEILNKNFFCLSFCAKSRIYFHSKRCCLMHQRGIVEIFVIMHKKRKNIRNKFFAG